MNAGSQQQQQQEMVDVRQTMEYKKAMELQVWLDEQKALYKAEVHTPSCWGDCLSIYYHEICFFLMGGSVAQWLACWTPAQKARVQIAAVTLHSNSLRQTVHTHHASVHQAAKLLAALLRVAEVTAGLAESNGSLPLGL